MASIANSLLPPVLSSSSTRHPSKRHFLLHHHLPRVATTSAVSHVRTRSNFLGSSLLLGCPPRTHFSELKLPRSHRTVRTAAALKDLFSFKWLSPKEEEGLKEKNAFSRREMVKMGPLEVSPMGFGTWAWGNQFLWGYDESMDSELQEVFNLMVSNGVNLFDTADSYGTGRLNGRSEELLGKFIREYPGTEKVQGNINIATKLAAYPWRLTSGQMVKALRGSLNRLGQEKISIGQLHWSASKYAPFQEKALWEGLVAMYEEGLVECVGVSNFGPRQLERIYDFLSNRGVKLASAQVQFSLLSTGPEQEEIKKLCDSLDISLIAYSPLGLGMLTGKYSPTNTPKGPRGILFKQILPGLDPLLRLQNEIAFRRDKTPSQVAINWCICKGTIPIPGAKNLQQAEENLGSLGWRLGNDEIDQLDEAASRIPRPMIQNIFQTK